MTSAREARLARIEAAIAGDDDGVTPKQAIRDERDVFRANEIAERAAYDLANPPRERELAALAEMEAQYANLAPGLLRDCVAVDIRLLTERLTAPKQTAPIYHYVRGQTMFDGDEGEIEMIRMNPAPLETEQQALDAGVKNPQLLVLMAADEAEAEAAKRGQVRVHSAADDAGPVSEEEQAARRASTQRRLQ